MFDSLEEVVEFAKEQLEHFGLSSYEVRVNNRLVRTLGQCSSRGFIELNGNFIRDNLTFNPKCIRDVVLHEIAHALEYDMYGSLGHSDLWKKCCGIVGAEPNEFVTKKIISRRRTFSIAA